jgi:hypothetical protein
VRNTCSYYLSKEAVFDTGEWKAEVWCWKWMWRIKWWIVQWSQWIDCWYLIMIVFLYSKRRLTHLVVLIFCIYWRIFINLFILVYLLVTSSSSSLSWIAISWLWFWILCRRVEISVVLCNKFFWEDTEKKISCTSTVHQKNIHFIFYFFNIK